MSFWETNVVYCKKCVGFTEFEISAICIFQALPIFRRYNWQCTERNEEIKTTNRLNNWQRMYREFCVQSYIAGLEAAKY
jgi:hypothetical protein